MRARVSWPASLLALAAGAGCRQDMHDQPRYKPLAQSDFFADQRSARPLVDGTVARGQLRDDDGALHGQDRRGAWPPTFPFPVTRATCWSAASERFDIYCTPCHDRARQRRRHDRAARLQAAAVASTSTACARRRRATSSTSSPTASAPCRTTRRRCRVERPLGDRGLHPRAAAEPARDAGRRADARSAPSSTASRRRRRTGARSAGPRMSADPTSRRGSSGCRRVALGRRRVVGLVGCAAWRPREPGAVLPLLPRSPSCSGSASRSAACRSCMIHHLTGGAGGS